MPWLLLIWKDPQFELFLVVALVKSVYLWDAPTEPFSIDDALLCSKDP
jgi:hypothetical protein